MCIKTIIPYVGLLCLAISHGACGGGGMKAQSHHNTGGHENENTVIANDINGDEVSDNAVNGKIVYEKYCILCHGDNGKMKLNGAKDITISIMAFDLRLVLIKDGKNLMTPFDGILTDEEIADVSAYSMTLKP